MSDLVNSDGSKVEYINARERFAVPQRRVEPMIDVEISRAVGFKVFALDPRVLSVITSWKKRMSKSDKDTNPDNFLQNPLFLKQLKESLSKPL